MDFKGSKRRYAPKQRKWKSTRKEVIPLKRRPYTTEAKQVMGRVYGGVGNGIVGPSLVTRAKYAEFTITSGSVLEFVTFRLNSMYDPNLTSTGHQPMGFDQLKVLYNRYRVEKATIRVTSNVVSATSAVDLAFYASNDAATASTMMEAKEYPTSKQFIVPAAGAVLDRTWVVYPWQVMGVSKAHYASDDRYSAAFGDNPAEQCLLHCFGCATDGSLTNLCAVNFTITFDVCYFDPSPVGSS